RPAGRQSSPRRVRPRRSGLVALRVSRRGLRTSPDRSVTAQGRCQTSKVGAKALEVVQWSSRMGACASKYAACAFEGASWRPGERNRIEEAHRLHLKWLRALNG